MRESGRWHTVPLPIVYCADHPSTALLETLVHLEVDFEDVPDNYKLLEIAVPDNLIDLRLRFADFDPDWQMNEEFSRAIGNDWFGNKNHPVLSAPSAILPVARIFAFNARHPDCSAIRLLSVAPVKFDPRLWKSN